MNKVSSVISFNTFSHNYSIDATYSTTFGRLVNDSPENLANGKMKREVISGGICLCLYAKVDIAEGTEIRYPLIKQSLTFTLMLLS